MIGRLGPRRLQELRYKEHLARTVTRGLRAAMAVRRLRALPPRVARQLFTATVAPTLDYASSVWKHACNQTATKGLNSAQRVGAQAVVAAFRTVALSVLEAEASIASIATRHYENAIKLWINIQTLSITHPLNKLNTKVFQRFKSALQKIAAMVGPSNLSPTETTLSERKHIDPYIAELAGMAKFSESLPPVLQTTQTKVFTSKQSALKAAANPCQQ